MTKMLSVQVKKCQLRNQPSFLGKIVSNLSYGDQVTVLEEKESWVNVQPPSQKGAGWVHVSALSTKKIVLNPGSSSVASSTSSEEIALAGKGFNEQVEQEFKKRNSSIDFTWIDKMEQIVIPQKEIQAFLQQGSLTGKGGKS
ncbi:MAG: SH3 domain-containing protein [Desulfobulbaceae bacterium]